MGVHEGVVWLVDGLFFHLCDEVKTFLLGGAHQGGVSGLIGRPEWACRTTCLRAYACLHSISLGRWGQPKFACFGFPACLRWVWRLTDPCRLLCLVGAQPGPASKPVAPVAPSATGRWRAPRNRRCLRRLNEDLRCKSGRRVLHLTPNVGLQMSGRTEVSRRDLRDAWCAIRKASAA